MAGIICIETEWQLTKRNCKTTLNTEPLIRFIAELNEVPYLYRRVATIGELTYYFKQLQTSSAKKKYNILYLSFHGGTQSISLEGEKEAITLSDLTKIGGDVFENRYVHFSSCRTLLGSEDSIESFKNVSKAKVVSGYTKTVASDYSAIHDIALFNEYINRIKLPNIFKQLNLLYGGLEEILGFKYFY